MALFKSTLQVQPHCSNRTVLSLSHTRLLLRLLPSTLIPPTIPHSSITFIASSIVSFISRHTTHITTAMCRVSQLQLSCSDADNQPHLRRPDELRHYVREADANVLSCAWRHNGMQGCPGLDIDPSLPDGTLRNTICSYCAVVQPAWDDALNMVIAKIRRTLTDHWNEIRDDFRDPERRSYDEPVAMQHKAQEICEEALQAVVVWREGQRVCPISFVDESSPSLSLASTHTSLEDESAQKKEEDPPYHCQKARGAAIDPGYSPRLVLPVTPVLAGREPVSVADARVSLPPLSAFKTQTSARPPAALSRLRRESEIKKLGGNGVRHDMRRYGSHNGGRNGIRSIGFDLVQRSRQRQRQRQMQARLGHHEPEIPRKKSKAATARVSCQQ
ncbi:hypothetical protein MN608_05325 [Microdochium nivale]|nr:hypothetical protein MN608_05325 [Microdochium nivale]